MWERLIGRMSDVVERMIGKMKDRADDGDSSGLEEAVLWKERWEKMRHFSLPISHSLNLLALRSKHTCQRMLDIKLRDPSKYESNLMVKLISVLEDPVQGMLAARILKNLCAHTETDYAELREVTASATKVVKFVMAKQGEHQEAALGLAAQIFKFMTKSDFSIMCYQSRELISELVEVSRKHPHPSKEVPSIMRFDIELLIGVMEMDKVAILSSLSMEMRTYLEALERVLETTSEMES